MTKKELIATGYTRHKYRHENQWLNRADELFQKRIYDASGDLAFFLNVYWYDYAKYPSIPKKEGWQVEVQFNTHADQEPTFNASLFLPDGWSVAQMEQWYLHLYRVMECGAYESASA